ncbi:sensor domain-containing diguanylate cyclase [Xanthomonas hortorum pv. vitians]|uniref:Sensor domain-containing diguanylate cyclase n=1 Tax=Xanthomonas hortorum pv. vitians TaxID=83224 RepID=A0A6V7DWH7_9XANT|nr:sensor domain-containing diguanylate cyclase [Xanthomonas hortorum]APP84571.1 GGDEF domain-containing protein [Xanthomonas hortorum pv. gardneri]ASW45574.1 histidine kinase [Xanthomonas hortorum]MCC8493499.1 sensor domain-containing diguanylate cyclase [Xanthomonas hortorum pv. gardneri]MCE4298023.1 sensor domain-containing diguanylate cyclase [Xanthomonas hortorum pv. vitians]MCE4302709.1 sensor domain-containing diguanylate cyclase [Xanthomonas hortorum pv. vitians]
MQNPDAPALSLIHATLLPGGINATFGARMPANEDDRLAALHDYQILDTAPEPSYDEFTAIAAAVCRTPMALISLIDTQRQWFKSRIGMQPRETPRDLSFCAHAILEPDQVMEVGDTHLDARFVDNALVTGEPQIRFYAGAPLLTSDGIALGTLCVLDRTPRRLSVAERDALKALARQVVTTIELRHAAKLVELDALRDELTGLWNRAGLERAVHALADAPSASPEQSLGFLLIDLDGFKRQKLQAGAAAADATLVKAASMIEAQLPPTASVARLNSDQLCVALPSTSAQVAVETAERIRAAIETATCPNAPLTVSIGLVDAPACDLHDTNTLLARARHALQIAVRSGRNRVHRFAGWYLQD